MNVVLLQGTLSSAPRTRALPSGSVLVSWEVTTGQDGHRLSVPVVWFDPPKSVTGIDDGEAVVVLGSVRRRFYMAAGRTVATTEVVATAGARSRRAKQAAQVCAAASDLIAEAAVVVEA